MADYSLSIQASARKELEALPDRDLRRIVERISQLGRDPTPQGAQKLTGRSEYRIRQGDYRILYRVEHSTRQVVVVKIGHRREVYR